MLRAYFIIALLLSTLAGTLYLGTAHSEPVVPEFTLNYVDYSYDVPPKTTSTTDPYTNESKTTTIPGYHVENKTVEVKIDNTLGASYYNLRFRGHYSGGWTYYPSDPDSVSGYNHYDAYSVPYQASTSRYTVVTLPAFFLESVTEGGEVDVQVQALFGNYRAVPYVHPIPLPAPTYDFYFEGTASDWSSTQTIKIGESQTPTPSPETTSSPLPNPYLTQTIGVALIVIVSLAGLGLLIHLIKRK